MITFYHGEKYLESKERSVRRPKKKMKTGEGFYHRLGGNVIGSFFFSF